MSGSTVGHGAMEDQAGNEALSNGPLSWSFSAF